MAETKEIKQMNKKLIQKVLLKHDKLQKKEIAELTGLSFPTVSRMIDDLKKEHLVIEETCASIKGRCAKSYRYDPLHHVFLLFRIEERMITWKVCDSKGHTLLESEEYHEDDLLRYMKQIINRIKLVHPTLAAIAIGIACNMHENIIAAPLDYSDLHGKNVKKILMKYSGLPVSVTRDMLVVSQGYEQKHHKEHQAFVSIYMGKAGAGAVTMINGTIWGGANEFAGEIHYLPFQKNPMYVINKFENVDVIEYYTQVICCYAITVNPDTIILYDNPKLRHKLPYIEEAVRKNLPQQAVPNILISDSFLEDYEAGLFAQAEKMLFRK